MRREKYLELKKYIEELNFYYERKVVIYNKYSLFVYFK